jgi:hypothetical protein
MQEQDSYAEEANKNKFLKTEKSFRNIGSVRTADTAASDTERLKIKQSYEYSIFWAYMHRETHRSC